MGQYTKYPDSIDSSVELPLSTDNVTAVRAEVVNRLRDAILALEIELGVQPSSTYGTVRDRLDALDSAVGAVGIEIGLNEETIQTQVTRLNFTGDVNVISSNSHIATVVIGTSVQKQEQASVTIDGQTSFTLQEVPLDPSAVEMFVNGEKKLYGDDYIVVDDVVTYLGPTLSTLDEVEFWYIVNATLGEGGGGSDIIIKEDGTIVDSAVTSINFTGDLDVSSSGPGIININLDLPTTIAGGDLSGTYPNPTVSKINGSTVNTTAGGDIGKALLVSSASVTAWSNPGGDLSGTFASTTVSKINGSTVNTTSGGDVGKALLVSSSGVTAWSNPGGDLSGTFANTTVSKINGSTVPTTSGSDVGKVLKVSAANTAIWSTSAAEYVTITSVTNTNDPYTVLATDYFIAVDVSTSPGPGTITINLPASPSTGKAVVIKDTAGAATDYNITISGNGKNIEGVSTYVISSNYGSASLVYNGTEWDLITSASSSATLSSIGLAYSISRGAILN